MTEESRLHRDNFWREQVARTSIAEKFQSGDSRGAMLLATARTGRGVELWKLSSGSDFSCEAVWPPNERDDEDFREVASEAQVGVYSRDGRLLMVGSSDGSLEIRNGANGRHLYFLADSDAKKSLQETVSDENDVAALTCSSGARYIATGGRAGIVRLFDTKSRTMVKSFACKFPIQAVAYNSSDSHLAFGGENEFVLVYSITSDKIVMKLSRRPGRDQEWDSDSSLQALAFSPSRKSLLAGVDDVGQVTIWDVSRKATKASTSTGSRFLYYVKREAHDAPCTSLSFVPSNPTLLCTAGFDKRIVCFDTETRTQLYHVQCDEPLTALTFTPDGSRLAASTTGGRILFFESTTKDWTTSPNLQRDLVLGSGPHRALSFLAFATEKVEHGPETPSPDKLLDRISPARDAAGLMNQSMAPRPVRRSPLRDQMARPTDLLKIELLSPEEVTRSIGLQETGTDSQHKPPVSPNKATRRNLEFNEPSGEPGQAEHDVLERNNRSYGSEELMTRDVPENIIRSFVQDIVDEMKQDVRSDVLNLHAELICQLDNQTSAFAKLLDEYRTSQREAEAEMEFLRKENKELRQLLGASVRDRKRVINL